MRPVPLVLLSSSRSSVTYSECRSCAIQKMLQSFLLQTLVTQGRTMMTRMTRRRREARMARSLERRRHPRYICRTREQSLAALPVTLSHRGFETSRSSTKVEGFWGCLLAMTSSPTRLLITLRCSWRLKRNGGSTTSTPASLCSTDPANSFMLFATIVLALPQRSCVAFGSPGPCPCCSWPPKYSSFASMLFAPLGIICFQMPSGSATLRPTLQ
mmetsp:Transcript_5376/g.12654  ORF Transcript_5376/g.12654 Transcript_5376/m.12654 type:complete len:214 (-) Transcript_5376:1888-2529(-)